MILLDAAYPPAPTVILLDAAYPPTPAQLVADCRALGAAGCWAYVLRRAADGSDLGTAGWTVAHVDALHAAGLLAPGIVVPGNVPPTGQACVDQLRALGCDLVLATDLEQYSLPPTWWEDQLEGLEAGQGVRGVDYGTVATLGAYDPGDAGWVAAWLRTGILQPVPALPGGRLAWQFVNDVPAPSGVAYDVSVVDPAIFGGTDMTPEEHNWLRWLYEANAQRSSDPTAPSNVDRLDGLIARDDTQIIPALTALQQAGTPASMAQLVQDVADLKATLGRIEAALRGA